MRRRYKIIIGVIVGVLAVTITLTALLGMTVNNGTSSGGSGLATPSASSLAPTGILVHANEGSTSDGALITKTFPTVLEALGYASSMAGFGVAPPGYLPPGFGRRPSAVPRF